MNIFNRGITPLVVIIIIVVAVILIGAGVVYYATNIKGYLQTQQGYNYQQNNQQNINMINNATAMPTVACGIHLQVQGGAMAAKQCHIEQANGFNRQGDTLAVTSYNIVIIGDKGIEEMNVSAPSSNGTYYLSSTKRDIVGVLNYNKKLTGGTLTITPSGTNNFNVNFNLSFEGNVTVAGYGVMPLKVSNNP
jgi:hypothetical protein